MNKNAFYLIFLLMAVMSCKKETNKAGCVRLSQNPGWITTDFKASYTIQFPTDYSGEGRVGFEGNVFHKVKSDNSVVFSYAYCSPVHCADFGETLPASLPGSISVNVNDSLINLNQQTVFCNGDKQTAILFYNKTDNAYGRLYWKADGIYKQAVEILFNQSRLQEIISIIKTVKEN